MFSPERPEDGLPRIATGSEEVKRDRWLTRRRRCGSPAGKVGVFTPSLPGRGDKDDTFDQGVNQSPPGEVRTEAFVAKAHQDDVGVVVPQPQMTPAMTSAVLAQAIGIQHGHGHNTHTIRANASNSGVIICDCSNDPGQPGTVGRVDRSLPSEPSRIEVPASTLAWRSGWEASIPVSRNRHGGGIGRLDRAIDGIPANLRRAHWATNRGSLRGCPRPGAFY